MLKNKTTKFPDPSQENSRIIALLTAALLALRLTNASDILSMFIISERIYQDMLLATEAQNPSDDLFTENIILRPFIQIDVDMKFRGFVFQQLLTCLSQYNYLIYSQRLFKTKLNKYKSNNYVSDFALTKDGKFIYEESINSMKVWVIELNPFMETTDGALFSWQHERYLLEGQSNQNKDKTLFRITEKVRPGSWAMLPISIRQWIKNNDNI
ncbi:unnamed protein product [Rotaria sp. Silwood2]|nr:unnamed protein product [Rotaria sp. Silwood2]